MNQLMENIEGYRIWQKGLELAETIQKMTDGISSSSSGDVWSTVRKMALSVPCYLAEGFMMKNLRDRRDSFYTVLNSLEEILKSLVLTEQMGYIKMTCIHQLKRDIIELNRKICVFVRPQQRLLSCECIAHQPAIRT